jgi:proline iminopeptidase/L-proline amide hydrolase
MPLIVDRRSLLALLGSAALWPEAAWAAPYPAPDRETMVPVEGGRIYVRLNGASRPERPPILLVHGGPGSGHSGYMPFLRLAGERPVILYDQLDAGRSDAPNDPRNWRVERFVDEIDAIRRAFGLERLHLYGGSWGGTVALEYAARRPAGLASLTLQNPLVSTRRWLADTSILRATLPAETQEMLRRCESGRPPPPEQCAAADEVFNSRFLRRQPRPPELEAYRSALPLPFNQRIYQAMWGRTEFVSTGTLRDYDGEPLLARLHGPRTLFITGQHDEARPETVAQFARQVPGSEFAVVPGSGHAIANDRPDELLALMSLWLRRNDGGQSPAGGSRQ